MIKGNIKAEVALGDSGMLYKQIFSRLWKRRVPTLQGARADSRCKNRLLKFSIMENYLKCTT